MKQHALGLKRRRENQANQITVRSGSSLFAILYIQLCLIINIMLNPLHACMKATLLPFITFQFVQLDVTGFVL